MDKLKKLLSLCKCSVSIDVNNHRDFYETVEQYFSDNQDSEDIEKETLDKMIETNTIVEIQFYPNTPVGFYKIIDYDLDLALERALSVFSTEP